jgi:hypothetical protein
MTILQQQAAAAVAVQFNETSDRRHIPGEAHQDCQTSQRPNLTNLPVNLAFSEGGRHIPFKIQQECQLIQLPKITDPRGSLSFIEGERHIPFKIRAAYWLYDTTAETMPASYAYRGQHEFIIAISGSIEVMLDNGTDKRRCPLNRPDVGLYVPNTVWRQIETRSTDAVVLILTSQPSRAEDHLGSPDELMKLEVLP